MASIRRHARSPFWYVRFRDQDTGAWREQSTGLRVDSATDTRKAIRIAEKLGRCVTITDASARFSDWVPAFLDHHCSTKSRGYRRRLGYAWASVRDFLKQHGLHVPRQVRYEHAAEYLSWRTKRCSHNTALLEVKFLSHLLNEAVRRGICESNPLARLGIGRMPSRQKRELSDEEIRRLLDKSKQAPVWLYRALRISLYTGCRFSETEIRMEDADLSGGTLVITDAKRSPSDTRKKFIIPMPDEIRHIFEQMRLNGEPVTLIATRSRNAKANYFIRRLCGIDASFHCLRVTFVTRCHRSGLSMPEAMRLVNHSSEIVHRVYSKLDVEDARRARARLLLPSDPR